MVFSDLHCWLNPKFSYGTIEKTWKKMNSWVIFLGVPSGYVKIAIEAMAIEIVDLSIKNGDFP